MYRVAVSKLQNNMDVLGGKYGYFYEYDCGLSGTVPSEIGNLDGLIKLRLQSNNLSGEIPTSICNLKIIDTGNYWFNLENNNLCPPYPDCLEELMGTQIITNCK